MIKKNNICGGVKYLLSQILLFFGSEKLANHSLVKCEKDNDRLSAEMADLRDTVEKLTEYVAKKEEEINKDFLTGLYTRSFLQEIGIKIIKNCQRQNQAWGVIFIDIDDFKLINDQYGHDVGDVVLIEVSKLLTECSRSGDFCVRWGGDEFVILLPNLNNYESLSKFANRLSFIGKKAFEETMKITLSVGGHFVKKGHHTSIKNAVKEADNAMYHSKNNGKDQVNCG